MTDPKADTIVTPKSGDPRDKTFSAADSVPQPAKAEKPARAVAKPAKAQAKAVDKDEEDAKSKATHVANGSCVTFEDVNGNRVHAKDGDYIAPCAIDAKALMRANRAIIPVALYEAQKAAEAQVAAAMAELG